MPELKQTFTGGKMEKDKDERIVPNGQYREALNISVATSEDSDVGAAQNILGNIKVTQAIQGRTQSVVGPLGLVNGEYSGTNANSHVAEIVDPKTDMLYRFINTESPSEGLWLDRIVEYDTSKSLDISWQVKEAAVMVDIYKVTANITQSQLVCVNGNKSVIRVDQNLNQLRWGMKVWCFGAPNNLTIEDINYTTGDITLDQGVSLTTNIPVTFYGDRNLNFSPDRTITGLNILDGVIFWTDNHSEPKKVEIERGKLGSNTSHIQTLVSGGLIPGLTGRHSVGSPKIDDFNQHTILIVDDIPQEDIYKDESVCPTYGCTNILAYNYDPNATLDDGSCCLDGGCMDPSALNFDSEACHHIGNDCCHVGGCTDPDYAEYDPSACYDDGSCNTLITFGCLWGYQSDSCGNKNDMVQVVSNDIFDVANSFELINPNNGLYDAQYMAHNLFQWFSLNDPSNSITQRWFMAHCSGCSFGPGWENDGNCSWEGIEGMPPGVQYSLQKQQVISWSFYDTVIQDANATPILGNSIGVTTAANICFSQGGCNAYGLFDTIDDVITFLRNHSVFDGTFQYYNANGVATPVPEITLGMNWDDIVTISEQTYQFFPPGGDGPTHIGEWVVTPVNCSCSDYYTQPTCATETDNTLTLDGVLYADNIACSSYCPPANWTNPLNITSYGNAGGPNNSGNDPIDDDGGYGGYGG